MLTSYVNGPLYYYNINNIPVAVISHFFSLDSNVTLILFSSFFFREIKIKKNFFYTYHHCGRALRMAWTSSATAIKQYSNCWRFWTIPPRWSLIINFINQFHEISREKIRQLYYFWLIICTYLICSKVAAMSISLQPLDNRFNTISIRT